MVPKIIHCVWLSGDDKPAVYQNCIDSWKEKMPDYEIREWSLKNLPEEVLDHKFVKGALAARKWAYATDYIRLWALHTYGGIYLDMDVIVYKSFDPFLSHRFFSSIELFPHALYKSINKKEVIGLGIEAAVMGSEKGHPFMADVMDYYRDLEFVNNPAYHFQYIMPRVLTRVAIEKYGFLQVPNFQIIKEGIYLYPCDVFSSVYDWKIIQAKDINDAYEKLASNPVRYSCHICAHAWYEGRENTKSAIWKLKHFLYTVSLAKYWKRKKQKFNI